MSSTSEQAPSQLTSPAARRASARAATWLLMVAGVAIVGAVVWEEVLEERFVAESWGVVVPGLVYRSGQISRHLVEPMLREHRIRTIVDLQGIDSESVDQQEEIEAAERLGIEVIRCPLAGDGTGDVKNYARAIAAIASSERAGRPVLVHCAAGAQRTGGVVATYRLLVRGEPVEQVYAEMQEYGWDADSDQELVQYVNQHIDELAQLLIRMGVTKTAPRPLPRLPETL